MSGKGAKGLSGKGAKGTLGGKGVDKDKKKPISRSARAGLQFPVGRIHRLLKVCPRPPASSDAAPLLPPSNLLGSASARLLKTHALCYRIV